MITQVNTEVLTTGLDWDVFVSEFHSSPAYNIINLVLLGNSQQCKWHLKHFST